MLNLSCWSVEAAQKVDQNCTVWQKTTVKCIVENQLTLMLVIKHCSRGRPSKKYNLWKKLKVSISSNTWIKFMPLEETDALWLGEGGRSAVLPHAFAKHATQVVHRIWMALGS